MEIFKTIQSSTCLGFKMTRQAPNLTPKPQISNLEVLQMNNTSSRRTSMWLDFSSNGINRELEMRGRSHKSLILASLEVGFVTKQEEEEERGKTLRS